MKTTLEIPDDLAIDVQRQATLDGNDVAVELVELLRRGLAASDRTADSSFAIPPSITTDPATGLPRIEGGPNAPIGRMNADQIYTLIHATQELEDLERAGIPIRR